MRQIAGGQGISRARCEVWDVAWRFAVTLLSLAVVLWLLSLCCCSLCCISMLLSLCRFSLAEVVQSEAWVDFAILRVAEIPVNMSILKARFETK
jgi:hypothetical protein